MTYSAIPSRSLLRVRSSLLPAFLLGLCAAGFPVSAGAATAPAACARITHGSGGAPHITVTSDGNTLSASGETLTGVPEAQSADLADAASVLLLAAVTGHHNAACSDWLETEGKVAESALAASHALSLSWTGVSVHHGSQITAAGAVSLTLKAGSPDAQATLSVRNVSYSGISIAPVLPASAAAQFSLPASELASLMAATAGKPANLPAVHVTIRSLTAQRETVTLSGNGRATLTGSNDSASASGHLEVTDIGTLTDRMREAGQTKVAAALILARLVSHHSGSANTWDTTWEGGVLTVNGVPLPLK